MNETVGLTNKINSQIADQLQKAQIDYDFYSTGFPITGIEKRSANHLFGNGKWKKEVKQALGDDTFFKNADMYGNRPIDFQLVGIRTDYSSYFLPNEKIIIQSNGVNKQAKVLDVQDKKYILIMDPYSSGINYNSGTIINASRMNGAKSAVDRFKQALADSGTINNQSSATEKIQNHENNFGLGLDKKVPPVTIQKPDHSKKIIVVIAIIAAILIGIGIYKNYNKTKINK